MERELLVVVEADPSRSHRAAEGLRIAAGLSMQPEIRLTVVLARKAGQPRQGEASGRVDAEVWEGALADLAENRVPVLEEEPRGVIWHGVIRFTD